MQSATLSAAFMPAAPLSELLSETNGDVAARPAQLDVEQLFRKHAPAIASLGVAMLGRSDEADDLVQDVFCRAIKSLHNLREPERVRDWLITIAVRQARTRLKKRRMGQLFLPREEVDYESVASRSCSPEDKLQMVRLFQVLEGLSADQRVAWVLRYLQAETVQVVADRCGWGLRTAKRRLRVAHEQVLKGMGA